MSELNSPWFLALDLDSGDKALDLARSCREFVGGFKVGPRLVLSQGPEWVKRLSDLAPVFLDFKFYDIPSTTEAAVRAAFAMGASFVTVHAANGSETLKRLSAIESELNRKRPFKILAVTVLTSFSQQTLPEPYAQFPIAEQVVALAKTAHSSGIRGLVCSAHEIKNLRRTFSDSYLVVPGIRLDGENKGDQKRVMAPGEALALGASALVIGRPVLQAEDPKAVARDIHGICKEKQ